MFCKRNSYLDNLEDADVADLNAYFEKKKSERRWKGSFFVGGGKSLSDSISEASLFANGFLAFQDAL
jgi:hypothetical protein